MANLKEINAAIKDGNKDIHALSENFKAWVESQKKSGDDLEAEREKKKQVKAAGGFRQIFQKQKDKKTGGLSMLNKAGMIALAALALPIILDFLKKNITDVVPNWLKDLQNGTLGDNTNVSEIVNPPVSSSTFRRSIKFLNSAIARKNFTIKALEVSNAKLLAENAKLKIGPPKTTIKAPVLSETRIDIKNRVAGNSTGGLGGSVKGTESRADIIKRVTASGGKVVNGSILKKMPDGKVRFTSPFDPLNANNPIPRTSTISTLKSTTSLSKNFIQREINKFKGLMDGYRLLPRPRGFKGIVWKDGNAFGNALLAYGQSKLPAPILKMLGWLFKMMGKLFTFVIIFDVFLLWNNLKFHPTKILPGGDPAIVPHKYTVQQQIEGTALILGGLVAAAVIGAPLGAAIGTIMFGPLGGFAGTLIGGYLAFQKMGMIIQFIYDIAHKENMMFHGERLKAAEARLLSKNVKQQNIISVNAALKQTIATSMKLLNSGRLNENQRVDSVRKFAKNNNIDVSGTIYDGPVGLNLGGGQDNNPNAGDGGGGAGGGGAAAKKIRKIITATNLLDAGLNLLGLKTANASTVTTAPNLSAALTNLRAIADMESTPTMGPGRNGARPVPLVVDSSSTTTNSTINNHMYGTDDLRTLDNIDPRLARWNSALMGAGGGTYY